MIKTGEKAPLDIKVLDSNGSQVSLRDLLGSYVVLYAYPMDETPGCVKEACSIRDVYNEFKELGVAVVGISPDNEKSHKKFAEHHELQFPLWADTKHELLNALGVWSFTGVARTTFLIDKEGTVAHVWEKVKPEGHGEEVLDFVTKFIETSRV
ncbi:MAG: Alkyl hydroperoxide reductase/ Thiol specific antioxidant/ Mal allergen [Parcubacteria group bacterium GW2011_GWA1_44_13]|uniref:thioredoxin-dependent peroxiredoxin n=1 Tax=Candidatus Nomurabacteria bacterium GW2011_GWB1_44_12 TaxID=1618748 RepID=A0A837I620_9BACT|nr:MAG: Alkyl hydroperoxide reductase/ Thiol specific antioxidant/ Mal allergen [Candidatus Nomurabacteria bacterium GW2011_GWB1_44_12]KKT38282.1 MAG: Alkyl hydroperoxide reductase/ Thiol specific antioxidant/ Mal allergen [Parcubacteria group bacterium GW2011_GWA1_44_13]KKT60528.1 MAG: Thiol peroxidase [Parcubacteria group bacterium GW2011_GWC1_44_26]HBB44486.1 peroxiredoxin [Candidatus Yonathbacteria bacterium]